MPPMIKNPFASADAEAVSRATSAQHERRLARLITLEGIDGCGKSTQARLLVEALRNAGYGVLHLREPGGVRISEKIRALLLDPDNAEMGDVCELLLYEAARAQLVHEVIAPALKAGTTVVCDRFYDSTTAYQGYADGLDLQTVARANELAIDGHRPDLTLVFDIDPRAAHARRAVRDGDEDRLEAKGLEFQGKVAEGFRAIAAAEPARVKLINAAEDIAHVYLHTIAGARSIGLDIPDDAARRAFLEAGA